LCCHTSGQSYSMLFCNSHQKHVWNASIINFNELPEGIAGVIPIIFSFFEPNPKSSQNILIFWGKFSSCFEIISQLLHQIFWRVVFYLILFGLLQAFSFVVIKCKNLGPFIFAKRLIPWSQQKYHDRQWVPNNQSSRFNHVVLPWIFPSFTQWGIVSRRPR
jgi:hypothetical protein